DGSGVSIKKSPVKITAARLCMAIERGDLPLIRCLVEHDPSLLKTTRGPFRRPSLLHAAFMESSGVIQGVTDLLLRLGADLDACSAALLGRDQSLSDILDRDPRLITTLDSLGFQTGGGTLLHWAARAANDLTVRLLLDRGADVNKAGQIGWTP